MTNGKTIAEVLKWANEKIDGLDARFFLKNILNCDDIYFVVHKDEMLSTADFDKYENFVNRRTLGEPLQYILNEKEFMGISFYVDENVLIPRNETEILVEKILNLVKDEKNTKILDLCTGSGAIAVSLAFYSKNADVLGVDISDKALKIAQKNAKTQNVKFKKCDVLCDICSIANKDEKFDIVVSNPPYIETEVVKTLDKNVRDFEPHLALDGGMDGLIFYKKIIEEIHFILKKDGYLLFEIGYNQGDDLKKLLCEKFTDIEIIKDYSNLDRIAIAKYKG